MARKKIGDLKATIGKEKIYIDDSRLKETGTIFLTIEGGRKIEYSYNVKDKTAGPHFTDTLIDVVRRANLGKDEGRMVSKIKTLWSTYRNQYNESEKQMAKQPTALKKITTAAKAIRKKQPGKSWKSAIKQASKDYRQTGGSSKVYDRQRKAKPPGKRRSASGKTYYERRKNRSDVPGKLTGIKTGSLSAELLRRKKAELANALLRRECATNQKSFNAASKAVTIKRREYKQLQ